MDTHQKQDAENDGCPRFPRFARIWTRIWTLIKNKMPRTVGVHVFQKQDAENSGCPRFVPRTVGVHVFFHVFSTFSAFCQVNIVGTTGAGDATIAGFLAALLRDLSPEQAMTMAVWRSEPAAWRQPMP
jgi:hypothetical protein